VTFEPLALQSGVERQRRDAHAHALEHIGEDRRVILTRTATNEAAIWPSLTAFFGAFYWRALRTASSSSAEAVCESHV